mgnify:CR=1 FL=1
MYFLFNSYQDEGWKQLKGAEFTDLYIAEKMAREASQNSIAYGTVGIAKDGKLLSIWIDGRKEEVNHKNKAQNPSVVLNDDYKTQISKLIINCMAESGISTDKISEKSGVDKSLVLSYIGASNEIDWLTLTKVFGAMGYKIDLCLREI